MRFIKNIDPVYISNIEQVSKQAYVSLCYSGENVDLSILEDKFGITKALNNIHAVKMTVDSNNKITNLNIFLNDYLVTP